MSRRKQPKPQHFRTYRNTEDVSPPAVDCCAHVCSRCCAEFSALSDLNQHQTDCFSNPPVLIVSEDEGLLSSSKTFPSASLPARPSGGAGETASNSEMEICNTTSEDRCSRCAEFMDYFSRSVESPGSSSSTHISEGPSNTLLCTSVYPEPSALPGCSADWGGYSWMKSSVIIENLESSKVALAQLSDSCQSKSDVSVVLQQLLALQVQQIHQLQLIDQIRHQVLLFASQQATVPESWMFCTKVWPPSKSTNQLKALSAHLSQQLAAAAAIAKCLSAHSENISEFKHCGVTEQLNQTEPDRKHVLSNSESLPTHSELVTTAVHEQETQTRMSSLMFSNDCFTSQNSFLHSSCGELSDSTSEANISGVVEDLDALAVLAQQRKFRNLKVSAPTLSSKDLLRCRFCAKDFGKSSALRIHLRSHNGERPYECNICGNWFSTQGNLKVHFQKHKVRKPHIHKSPYLVPNHLDQTNTGISFIVSPEKAAATWFDMSASAVASMSGCLEQSHSTNPYSLIKTEENLFSVPTSLTPELNFDSSANTNFSLQTNSTKTSDSMEIRKQRTVHLKSEVVNPSLNIISPITTTNSQGSVSPLTHPRSTSFPRFLSFTHPDNFQLPSDASEKKVSDPNECIICHRIVSCQSALRMHYRMHTGDRPYQCKLCGQAFTTKGNLRTHQAHHASVSLKVKHSCPICQRKFSSAVVLQRHVHMHMEDHLTNVDLPGHRYLADNNRKFQHFSHRKNVLDDNNEGFSESPMSKLKSLSIHLSPSEFGKNLIHETKKTSFDVPPAELQLRWIKTERTEGSNEDCSPTNNQQAAEKCVWTNTSSMSDSSASTWRPPPNHQPSMCFNTTRLDKTLQTWLNSNTLMLCPSAVAPTEPKLFNLPEDSPSFIHSLRQKVFLRNTYCDICGKNFACQSALDIHFRSHTKERPFICATCSRGFSTKGNLKQHMLTHQMKDFPSHLFEPSNPNQTPDHMSPMLSTGTKAVKMKVAAFLNSSFSNVEDLSGHSQSSYLSESTVRAVAPPRRTPKQHHCKTCGKSFSSSSALQIHERTHTGERPFACAMCGRAFTTKGNLKVHMGTHVWNSASSRRGRRLSVDRSSVVYGIRPVKLPEPPQRDPANSREPVYRWNQSPEAFSVGLNTRDDLTLRTGRTDRKDA